MRLSQRGEAVELALERREPAGDARGVGLVVPEVGRGDLLAEVGDLGCASRRGRAPGRWSHRRLELLDLGVEVGACHKEQGYGASPQSAYSAWCTGSAAPPRPASHPRRRPPCPRRRNRSDQVQAAAVLLDLGQRLRLRPPAPPSSTSIRSVSFAGGEPDPVRRARVGERVGGELAHHQQGVVELVLDPPVGQLSFTNRRATLTLLRSSGSSITARVSVGGPTASRRSMR